MSATVLAESTGPGAPPAPAAAPSSSGRLARLDVLRAIAIFLVIGRHIEAPPADATGLIAQAIHLWQKVGWFGVDLFFVLSGFLVSGLLFREHQRYGGVSASRFLIRRGFKIYPAFYVFIAITAVFGVFRRPLTAGDLAWQVFFLQSYAPWIPGAWDHTWSLAVEEHFYLLLAAVAAWRLRPGGRGVTFRQVLIGCATIAIVILAARCVTTWAQLDAPRWNKRLLLFPTHLRLDSLLFGVLLAYVHHYQAAVWRRLTASPTALVAAGFALLAPSVYFDLKHPFTTTIGYTLYYVGFGALLVAALARSETPTRRFSPEAALAYIGASSYSIYLWHMPLIGWSEDMVRWATGHQLRYSEYLAFGIVGSIVVGIVMARIVEGPVLRLRDRYFPSRSAALARAGGVPAPDYSPVLGADAADAALSGTRRIHQVAD